MSKFIKLANSNWEMVVFALINKIVGNNYSLFEVSTLKRQENIDYAISLLGALGHKEHPEAPEFTIQHTINTMKKKKYIEPREERGSYKITLEGRKAMEEYLSSDNWKLALAVMAHKVNMK
ncbi:MAG: hypothetical protein V1806_16300 [Pseudomonadota bacterium]